MNKHIFYEESGQFKVAVVVQQTDATYLVDTQHGKRAKVKTNHVFLTFNEELNTFLETAQQEAAAIDIDLLWEVCGEDEFSGEDAAREYFGGNPKTVEQAATFIALYAAPMYFYKKNKGIFKAAPADILKQALAAAERKRCQEAQIDAWAAELSQGRLPEAIAADAARILHTPDKQSLTFKAVSKAAAQQKTSVFTLMQAAGAIPSLPQYFLDGFLLKNFPKGIAFGDCPPPIPPALPQADSAVRAFSIDDTDTTEIDDALSLQHLPNGNHIIGIHIAAPSLAIAANSTAESWVFTRQSTVYYPGGKITMLPPQWIAAFSLDAGAHRPAVSLYAEVDVAYQIISLRHAVETVYISENLRIQAIETTFQPQQARENTEAFVHQHEMNWLYDFAIAQQKARGKYDPERIPQFDYSIDLGDNDEVHISVRERGSPIDTLVSEMMILANSTWAKMLADAELPTLFRVQPAGKVRMSTQSEPHIGLGLQHYAWFTSPLRRAADYINQKQLLSIIDPNNAPRFAPKDEMLFAALRDFESAYTQYADFQKQMESYWSLVYIRQQNLHELTAVLLRDDLVRIEGIPLVARVNGIPIDAQPKSRLKLAVTGIDLPQISIGLNYVNVLV
ncbi:ribonuclease catalytic domain-containing protein [Stenoxybacter acetivorans]|uniref:ribonuclease catalytic domain-containing protein n=1 Tax=Stenoxybacter acetivorans TaxID=422441 RepID=UPI00056C5ED3|nr:RNB domain-containing ribonuclease [Stenoxybacter acetivorans]